MYLETGKKYKLRNGLTTGFIKKANNGTNYVYEAKVIEPNKIGASVLSWLRSGRSLTNNKKHKHDIIEEIN